MCFHPWEVLWVLEGDGKLGAKEGNVLSSAPQGGRGPQRGRGGSGGGLGGGRGSLGAVAWLSLSSPAA